MGRAQQNAVVELLRIAPVADELAARFIAAGHALYLVGGSVRDALLGRLGSRLIAGSAGGDLDFTTDARPDAIAALLRGWADVVWDTGIAFGTVGASKGGIQCEITTYRADRYDRVSRNPEVVFGDTIEDEEVYNFYQDKKEDGLWWHELPDQQSSGSVDSVHRVQEHSPRSGHRIFVDRS